MKNALVTTDRQPPQQPATAKQPRALLIENDQDSRELMKFILETKGFNVLAIEDGEQFLALRDELPPDLIIINVLMPVDKDFGILRQIRQQASLHNVPTIVTSIYPNSIVRSESLRAKCLAFFAKPIDFDKLNDLIEEFLSRHSNGH